MAGPAARVLTLAGSGVRFLGLPMRKPLFLLAVLMLAVSCRSKPSVLVLLDPYLETLLENRGLAPEALRRGLEEKLRARVLVLDPAKEPMPAVEHLLAELRPGWAYLSPLLPLDAHVLASRFPEVRIVQEGSGPGPEPNLVRLEFQREEAFRRAGRAVARLLTQEALRPVLGSGERAAPAVKAAVVLGQPLQAARQRAEAFRAGFLSAADAALLLQRDLDTLSDTAKARKVLESLREQGVRVFLLQTYGLTGFCLEYLRTQGGLAVLEEPVSGSGYEEQVLLSLQEDLPAALRLLGGADGQTRLEGPVRLAWGKPVRELPPEARALLDE
jgi:hypothetical protein